MNYGREYLTSYGWNEGQALQAGGIAKPILVKHKFDQKGLGSNPQDNVAWWERVFDGQLKSMQLGDQGFVRDEKLQQQADLEDRRRNSPLYKVFVKGQGLQGSIKLQDESIQLKKEQEQVQLMIFDSDSEDEEAKQKRRLAKKLRKQQKKDKKKEKKAKKEKKLAKKEKKKLAASKITK